MSAATGPSSLVDSEDLKKVADQVAQSFLSITNHVVALYPNSADAQKSVDKVKSIITKGFENVRINNIHLFRCFVFSNLFLFSN